MLLQLPRSLSPEKMAILGILQKYTYYPDPYEKQFYGASPPVFKGPKDHCSLEQTQNGLTKTLGSIECYTLST